jgi:hypothetical protein
MPVPAATFEWNEGAPISRRRQRRPEPQPLPSGPSAARCRTGQRARRSLQAFRVVERAGDAAPASVRSSRQGATTRSRSRRGRRRNRCGSGFRTMKSSYSSTTPVIISRTRSVCRADPGGSNSAGRVSASQVSAPQRCGLPSQVPTISAQLYAVRFERVPALDRRCGPLTPKPTTATTSSSRSPAGARQHLCEPRLRGCVKPS